MPSRDNRDAGETVLGVEAKQLLRSIYNEHLRRWKKDHPGIDEKLAHDDENVSFFLRHSIITAALC